MRKTRDLANSDSQMVEFAALCCALGASSTGGALSTAEAALLEAGASPASDPDEYRARILSGGDPLGDRIIDMRSSIARRRIGQVFTPQALVDQMVAWTSTQAPARIVDCGCGSGRFAIAAARTASGSQVVAVDLDPVSTLACRANAAVFGIDNLSVRNEDFVRVSLAPLDGLTAFIGNPPYVRHHDIPVDLKAWARSQADDLGWSRWSGLAGLHALFFMAVVSKSAMGDVGCLLTSSEWLDINYGRAMRDALLNGAGGRSVHVLRPEARAFDEAMVTASIVCFERGHRAASIRIQSARRPSDLYDLGRKGRAVSRARLEAADGWSEFTAPKKPAPQGLVRLGDYVRVSRGAVTGGNRFFLLPREVATELGVSEHCVPAVTRAREVIESGGRLDSTMAERCLLVADPTAAKASRGLSAYLRKRGHEFREGYVCRSRHPWYAVPVKQPPVVATYMGRGRPSYALNPESMPIVNVVHGLYPKVTLDDEQLQGLVSYLNTGEEHGSRGRTYQGGLRKYEPGEMESLLVPSPDKLRDWADRES